MSYDSSFETWDPISSTVCQSLLPCLSPSLSIDWGGEAKSKVEKPKTNQKWTSSYCSGLGCLG